MTFTDLQLSVFRERYPRIPKYMPLLKELETWVATNAVSNPDRIPTPKGWGNFLNNCARMRHKDIISGRRRADGSLVTAKQQSNAEYYNKPEQRAESMSKQAANEDLKQLRNTLATTHDPHARKRLNERIKELSSKPLSVDDVFKKILQ